MIGNARKVFILGAKRTAVAPRNGAFADLEVAELVAPLMSVLLQDSQLSLRNIDQVILGNALYGGGNPARVAALAAGLDQSVPALTIDSQCCAGLDSIGVGAAMIASGQAKVVVAGGVESYSRSPLRAHRPRGSDEKAVPYNRPPFTPWPDMDPDMIEAAAALADELKISRAMQEHYAIASHAKALAARVVNTHGEIVAVNNLDADAFSRQLTEATCARLSVLAGSEKYGLTPATIAVEADAAALVLLVDEATIDKIGSNFRAVEVRAVRSAGGDPRQPALAPIEPAQTLLHDSNIDAADLVAVEIMEAFAVQSLVFVEALGIPQEIVNRGGGALARGHPIGASGAILAVRLFHELQQCPEGSAGLAAIAAAGGLGSAALFQI